jgi:hypothetical protein
MHCQVAVSFWLFTLRKMCSRTFSPRNELRRPTSLDAWLRIVFPLYTRTPRGPNVVRRSVGNPEVLQWFTKPGGEDHTFNMIAALARRECPTLVMGGVVNPTAPIECRADIAAAVPPHLVQLRRSG